MISPAACLLYTQDSDLVRRTRAFLRNRASVRHVDETRSARSGPPAKQPGFAGGGSALSRKPVICSSK